METLRGKLQQAELIAVIADFGSYEAIARHNAGDARALWYLKPSGTVAAQVVDKETIVSSSFDNLASLTVWAFVLSWSN